MKVRKAVKGYVCPVCEEASEGEPEEVDAWRCESVDDDGLTREEPTQTRAFVMDCCSALDEEKPAIIDLWQCGECEEMYEIRADAAECCKD